MAKIRFEGVQISAKVIEVDEIADPSGFLKGLGLEGAKVNEGISYETKGQKNPAPPVPEVDIPKEVPSAAQIEQIEEAEKQEIDNSDFEGARRLRDVVQVFMDRGVTDTDEIVSQCIALKESVSILKRVTDIEGRMPIAVNKWHESNIN